MGDKQSKPQEGKVTFFKPQISKVISDQTEGGFTVITSKKKNKYRALCGIVLLNCF